MSKIPASRKAPPPDRPLNVGGSGIHFPSQIKTKTPDWNFWGAMPKATHLQACILSIGIDPDSLRILDRYSIEILPIETQEILTQRLRLLDANRCDSTIFTPPMERYSGLNTMEVLLSEFAAWGVSLGWDDMPQELSARAQGRATSPPAGGTQTTPDVSGGGTVSPTAPLLASKTQPGPVSGPVTPAAALTVPPSEGITKQQVLIAFEALVKPFNLKKALENGKGLYGETAPGSARTQKGTPGAKHAALWNPVILAVGLRDKYSVPMLHLKGAFNSHSFLRKWADEWNRALDSLGE